MTPSSLPLACPQRLVRGAALSGRHAGCAHIASALVQNHRDDLVARAAFEVELRVDDLVKERVLGAREDREGGLPGELGLEMIALAHHIEHTEIELVFADIIAGRSGIE